MIESITIGNVATFGDPPEELKGLSQFNFLFGTNGTGKTTVSRVIADEASFPTCKVAWKGGTKLQTLVYNRDFVERNFSPSGELKGVFTLGEKQADTLTKIAAAKADLDALTAKIEVLTQGLQGTDGSGGKKGELAVLESGLKDTCWARKQKHDVSLHGAFEGYRGSSEKFKGKVLQELASNTETLVSLEDLQKRAETIFGPTPTVAALTPVLETTNLITHEANQILKKRVIGKDDVDIAAMIKKLSNSDWVREGRSFFDVNDRICPFCQQSTSDKFAQSLNEYFDEAFLTDSKAIDDLETNYATEAAQVQQQLGAIISTPSKFLDIEQLKAEKELLDSKITINLQRLAAKKKEASRVVELDSVQNVAKAINALIDSANSLATTHNNMVANLSKERQILTAQVWQYVLDELKADLVSYKTKRDSLDKAIAAMTAQIAATTKDKEKKIAELRELEKQTTSVQPTVDAINALFSSFGFQGFSLAVATNGTSYRLVRPDGSDAKMTLSEGERTFITFLYFYHLLKGSESESGITTDRVVVFDDPVSSLDSDILFIVGSLIKRLLDEVRSKAGHVKQVFVLTHNVYFHKEVTFNPKRNNVAMNEETFWIVRRPGLASKIVNHPTNPVNTSYDLLWSEVRRPDHSHLTIQNTLRRILENYFKFFGGVDPKEICSKFSGKEQLICNTLLSWINDGSHYAQDDLYMSIDESAVNTYLNVFRGIFDKSGHLAHYKMMMGDAFEEEQNAQITQLSGREDR
jgi:wobble nucleotide-excising tRNase